MTLPVSICVYCGSSADVAQTYKDAAAQLGRYAGEQGVEVVYGGGRVGLMGLVADSAIAAGGKVTGIIPSHILELEVAHQTLTELIVVDDMHTRKKLMFDRSAAFVVLPGGLGTLDEAFEILTWKQLGLHDRRVIIVNIAGYWDPFLALVESAVEAGFIRAQHARLFDVADDIPALIEALESMQPVSLEGVDAVASFT